MNQKVIVIGAGGHAKVVVECLQLQSLSIIGIVDSNKDKLGHKILGVKVVGDDSLVFNNSKKDVLLVNAIGVIRSKSMNVRENVFNKFKKEGYLFYTLVHPSAVVASDVVVREGAQILAGSVVRSGSVIGENTILNTSSSIDHDCNIGSHAHIAPGALLCGEVDIGTGSYVGARVTVIQKIKIGTGSLIAAGATVISNVSNSSKMIGNPAKKVEW